MILRMYKGRKKRAGRQQVSSQILISAVRRISDDFFILKEARREVMEDLMDVDNAINVLKAIEQKKIKLKEIQTTVPTPFAFNLVLQGYSDILKMEDKADFLRRMHRNVLVKISLKKGKKKVKKPEAFSYPKEWKAEEDSARRKKAEKLFRLRTRVASLKDVPFFVKEALMGIVDGKEEIKEEALKELRKIKVKKWPKELRVLIKKRL